MQSWPPPYVPRLPPSDGELRLHDTSSRSVRPTAPGPVAAMYVCGITPYDATHLGHAATYVAFDLLNRAWRDAGHQVHYVQNVTDVDDPLLERALRDGVDWTGLAEEQTTLFREDMTALGVLPPRHYVGAVEAIPQIIEAVRRIQARGASYDLDGDVYFSVHADGHFGSVSGLDREAMAALFAERGGDPDRPGKADPLDCLLWQAERAGEPAWDSPLGRGRPGWHVECTAIALQHLGPRLDLMGGGSDLAFPHHEMGASEATVDTGQWPFAGHYVHAGMVGLDGEKMSKSRGNLVFVSTLRHDGVDPMAIRLALLAHHYRSDWEWTAAELGSAQARLGRWQDAVGRPDGPPAADTVAAVRAALRDDLDAPAALAAIDDWVALQAERGGPDMSAPGLVSRAANALLGIRL